MNFAKNFCDLVRSNFDALHDLVGSGFWEFQVSRVQNSLFDCMITHKQLKHLVQVSMLQG